MNGSLLLIEDDENKRTHIRRFLAERLPIFEIHEARSYRTAMNKIRAKPPDLLLLDMAIPTFDVGPDEPGGQTRFFGGREILRQLDRFHISVPVIVITQFDHFTRRSGMIDLEDLDRELKAEHSNNYFGAVYYHPSSLDWQQRLLSMITQIGLT